MEIFLQVVDNLYFKLNLKQADDNVKDAINISSKYLQELLYTLSMSSELRHANVM